jgi:hypothetical protein
MFVMRKGQFDALEISVIAQANARLAQYARNRFPGQFRDKSEGDLIAFAAEIRRRAGHFGITAEADLATVLDLSVMYGADFYAADWVRDVFAVPDWDGAHKLEVLRTRVRRQVPDF